jgi:hypothetical protein
MIEVDRPMVPVEVTNDGNEHHVVILKDIDSYSPPGNILVVCPVTFRKFREPIRGDLVSPW